MAPRRIDTINQSTVETLMTFDAAAVDVGYQRAVKKLLTHSLTHSMYQTTDLYHNAFQSSILQHSLANPWGFVGSGLTSSHTQSLYKTAAKLSKYYFVFFQSTSL